MVHPTILTRYRRLIAAAALLLVLPGAAADAGRAAVIERIKPSIVAVGTFERLRNPQFHFAGTGFAVDDGLLIATNAHVLPRSLAVERDEVLAVAVRGADGKVTARAARTLAADSSIDLALLRIPGPPLAALALGDSEAVREGETVLFTGYPIGAVLGLYPVTHMAMIASITPIAIPAPNSGKLDARTVRRLASGSFPVFQLDGTAYPGNSGSPVYDAGSGRVIAIVNSVVVKSTRESALSQPTGITYAIPAQRLRELLEAAR